MTLAQQFILANVLGAVFFFGLGYVVATRLRHKRTTLLTRIIYMAFAKAQNQDPPIAPTADELVSLIERVDRAPDHSIWASHAMRIAIYREPPDDPH